MISERRRHTNPGIPLLLFLLPIAVVSTLGIFRGSRRREVLEALARQYLKRE